MTLYNILMTQTKTAAAPTAQTSAEAQSPIPFLEFVALMASMTALTALSIDAMLPALGQIAQDLGAARANDSQLVISLIFFGLGLGQIIFGPISDSVGRKPAIYAGFVVYAIGSLLCLFTVNFQLMLVGRFLQGFGVAGPRGVSIALVRDQFEGRAMARVMSFVMTVFILVPIVAPLLGQGILLISHWRGIFVLYLMLVVGVTIWFALRQPETLPAVRRTPFRLRRILGAFREVFLNRIALGYTVMAGLSSGGFVGYLNSSQQIFQEQYGLGARFPLVFGILAVALGMASFSNARLVMRFGMRNLSRWALWFLSLLSLGFLVVALWYAGNPPLWLLMSYMMLAFFAVGILFGNLNAQAMEPVGHIAGVGAAVVGSVATLISAFLGGFIGQSYNGTVLPLVIGFTLFSAISLGVMRWANAGSNSD